MNRRDSLIAILSLAPGFALGVHVGYISRPVPRARWTYQKTISSTGRDGAEKAIDTLSFDSKTMLYQHTAKRREGKFDVEVSIREQ